MKKQLMRCAAVLWLAACAPVPAAVSGHIEVYRSDGARQCEGEGLDVAAMQPLLGDIRVYAARKDALADRMFPAVCGGATGSINVYTIDAADEAKARMRGFERLPAAGGIRR